MCLLYMTRLEIFVGQKDRVKPIILKRQFTFQLCLFKKIYIWMILKDERVMKRKGERKWVRESHYLILAGTYLPNYTPWLCYTRGLLERYVNTVRALTLFKTKSWSCTMACKAVSMVHNRRLEELCSPPLSSTGFPVRAHQWFWVINNSPLSMVTYEPQPGGLLGLQPVATMTASYIGPLGATVNLFQMSIWREVSICLMEVGLCRNWQPFVVIG